MLYVLQKVGLISSRRKLQRPMKLIPEFLFKEPRNFILVELPICESNESLAKWKNELFRTIQNGFCNKIVNQIIHATISS